MGSNKYLNIFVSKSCYERISEYICIQKVDTNEYPNIFVSKTWYKRIFEYSNIFVTLCSTYVRDSIFYLKKHRFFGHKCSFKIVQEACFFRSILWFWFLCSISWSGDFVLEIKDNSEVCIVLRTKYQNLWISSGSRFPHWISSSGFSQKDFIQQWISSIPSPPHMSFQLVEKVRKREIDWEEKRESLWKFTYGDEVQVCY